jgi:hypothetical protein
MGGGSKEKSVVYDIMEFENRQLYYLINNIPQKIQIQNINIDNKENKNGYEKIILFYFIHNIKFKLTDYYLDFEVVDEVECNEIA